MAARVARGGRPAAWLAASAGAEAAAVGLVVISAVASLASPAIPGAATYSRLLVVALIGAAGCGLLTAGVALRAASAFTWAAAALAGAWLVAIAGSTGLWPSITPLVAGALLAGSELAHWSLDLRPAGVDERGIRRRRATAIALLGLGGAAAGAVPAMAASAGSIGGEDLALVAVAAVVATAVLAVALETGRRRAPR